MGVGRFFSGGVGGSDGAREAVRLGAGGVVRLEGAGAHGVETRLEGEMSVTPEEGVVLILCLAIAWAICRRR